EQLVTRELRPGRDVGLRARVGREQLEQVALLGMLQRLVQRDERPGAGLASCIHGGGDDVHRWEPPWERALGWWREECRCQRRGLAALAGHPRTAASVGDHRPDETTAACPDHCNCKCYRRDGKYRNRAGAPDRRPERRPASERPNAFRRPPHPPHACVNVPDRHRSEPPAVRRTLGFVPFDPYLVNQHAPVRGLLAGDVDDALDELEARTLGVLDDDDVAAAHLLNADRERPVAGFERRTHRRPRHFDPGRPPALEPVRCSDTGEQDDEHRLPRLRTPVVGSGHGTPIVRRRERMLEALLRPRRIVHAHCDLPCGIYDPAQARVEAESVKAIQTRYQDAEKFKTAGESVEDYRTRALAIKEARADLVKEHLWVLWTDYFKPEHLEKFPQLHDLFWNATKEAGLAKKAQDPAQGQKLLDAIDEIGKVFAESKK